MIFLIGWYPIMILLILLTIMFDGAFHSQEVPPTPGQPVKEPMFIPVAVGLLDSAGKDIPLSSVYHDGTFQSIASDNQPVYTTVLRVTKVRSELIYSVSSLFHISMKKQVIFWLSNVQVICLM